MINCKQLVSLVAASCIAISAFAKTSRTYYTDAEVAAIRQRAADPRYKSQVDSIIKAASIVADCSDEDLWNMVPPAELTRALTVRYQYDCPVHGEEIYKVGGRFPWITSSDKPYVVECPVGHESYPSNDFAAYLKNGRKEKLDTTQKYVDDGDGYVDEKGNHYFFAGYYNFWHLWRKTLIDGVANCGNAYLITGDEKYAHKAAIALASISRVYPQMNYSKQAYHNGKWPAGINGRVLDYIWENQTVGAWAVAYDQIYPTLSGDEALKALAAKNGVDDVKASIEKNIFQEMASDLLEKKIWGNKFELRSTSTLALVLDNHDKTKGITSEQMIEWLLKGGGELEFTFYNGFDRDGWGGESSLSYSRIWNSATVAAAVDLSRLGVGMVQDPKWLRLAKAPMEMRILDKLYPRLGDIDGHIKGTSQVPLPELLTFGVTQFKDADCAAALLKEDDYKAPLLARHSLDTATLRELAKNAKLPPPPYTRDFGGYGLAVLELNDGDQTHSATIYYGSPYASHGHSDRLTMSYHIGERDIFPDLGYPSQWGSAADLWVKNTPSHYCVLVDEKAQPTRFAGSLTRFVDIDGLKLAEAQAKQVWAYPPPPAPVPKGSIGGEVDRKPPPPAPTTPYQPRVDDYRRMLALLDTGEKSTLVIEAFFVTGGKQHDYSFHGLPYGEFSCVNSSVVREQSKGTLAGVDIEYGQDPGNGRAQSGYQFLSKPRWFEANDAMHFAWRNDEGYNQDTWFPRLSFDEVVVADGKPPVYPGWPATMPFILLRHKGDAAGLQSVFLSISDAGKKNSAIRNVKPIKSNSANAGGAEIELVSGTIWRIYVNGGTDVAQFADQTKLSASLGAVRLENGKPVRAKLAGEGTLEIPGFATFSENARSEWTVRQVNYQKNSAVVDGAAIDAGTLGTVVLASRGDNPKASYTAKSFAKTSDGVEIQFADAPLITGRFEAKWDASQRKIVSKERTGGVYNQFVAKSFVGMSVVNEDFTATAAIVGYDGEKESFTIDADEQTALKFNDCNGDGRAYVYIADIAPGVHLSATPAQIVDLAKEKK
jgi:hypothetical protein